MARAPSWWLRLLLRGYPTQSGGPDRGELLAFWQSQREEPRYQGALGSARYVWDVGRDASLAGLRARWRSAGTTRRREEAMWSSWATDLREAHRSLRSAPLFTVVSVSTLAVGIAATTALFAVVEGVLLRPLPYPDADRLVQIRRVAQPGISGAVGWPDFVDWDAQAPGFDGMAAATETEGTFEWPDGAEAVTGARVTHDYFEVVGVLPLLGRSFTPEEDRMGGPVSVVLSHGFWHRAFGGDPGVLGRTVPLDGEAVPVVGVMPEGFGLPDAGAEFWIPLQGEQLLEDVGLPTGTRTLSFLDVLARVGDLEADRAGEALRGLARRIDEEAGKEIGVGEVTVVRLQDAMVGDMSRTLTFLLAAGLLVLVVACANVAGLAFTRAAVRDRELAVRAAIGASRSRLLCQLMAESAMLTAVAGALGLGLGWGLTRALVHFAPREIPRLAEVGFGAASVGFGIGVTVVSALLFGLIPAVRASATSPSVASTTARSSASRGALRPQQLLVAAQVAVSVVLLIGAALLGNSFTRLLAAERGFDTEDVLVASIQPSESRYPTPAEIDAFYGELLERVRALPGVVSTTSTNAPPLVGNGFYTAVVLEGQEENNETRRWVGTVVVRDDYFEASGVPLLAGRRFDSGDRLGEPLVAIVSRRMADELWPGEDPLGKRFRFAGGMRGSADSFDPAFFPREDMTVVGVAGNVRRTSLDGGPEAEYYRPHAQLTWAFQYLVVRTRPGADNVAAALRDEVWALDPTIPVRSVRPLGSQLRESVATPRFRLMLLLGFAVTTCALAMVGLYAVMALAVARRTREVGIRIALGASRGGVLGRVMARGFRLVAWGLLAGMVTAWGFSRVLTSMLFEVTPTDAATYAVVAGVVGVVATLACYVPARRASRVDPVVSLQAE